MSTSRMISGASAIAVVLLFAGCATWKEMDRSEKGTAVGATGGAIAGAAVGGPVGAAVGAGVGAYAGHHEGTNQEQRASASDVSRDTSYNASTVRSAQRGYDPGPVDCQEGPTTESAVRQFQQSRGLTPTGSLDPSTLSALGVSQ